MFFKALDLLYVCGKQGHIGKVYPNRISVRKVELGSELSSGDSDSNLEIANLSINQVIDISDIVSVICCKRHSLVYTNVEVEGVFIEMEADSSSPVSIASEEFYNRYFSHIPLVERKIKLK